MRINIGKKKYKVDPPLHKQGNQLNCSLELIYNEESPLLPYGIIICTFLLSRSKTKIQLTATSLHFSYVLNDLTETSKRLIYEYEISCTLVVMFRVARRPRTIMMEFKWTLSFKLQSPAFRVVCFAQFLKTFMSLRKKLRVIHEKLTFSTAVYNTEISSVTISMDRQFSSVFPPGCCRISNDYRELSRPKCFLGQDVKRLRTQQAMFSLLNRFCDGKYLLNP